jgi:hypothetical protein
MLPMTMARTGGSLVCKLIKSAIFCALFIPMFIYELSMFMIGKRKYSKQQYEREFEYGYNPPVYGGKETDPKYPEVWAHALEKTYDEFAKDLRLAALMGIIYRFREPKTIEEFDEILLHHITFLRREPDSSGNMTADRLWNPANITRFLDAYYKKHGFGDFTHYYIHEKGSTNEWRIIKLGIDQFKPQVHSRAIEYYCEYTRDIPALFVNYSFSGDETSISTIRFYKTADAEIVKRTVSTLSNFVIAVISAMVDERDAAAIIAKLDVSEPQPFECVLQSARMKLDWEISRPYWSEPDQGLAYFTIEKV